MIDCRPYIQTLQGKPIAVFGLGVSGLATVEALCKADGEVIAFDDSKERCEQAAGFGAHIKPLDEAVLAECAVLVLAPGVPLTHPEPHAVVKAAQAAGTEILCDIEILNRLSHGRTTIGITGTNGKSTTTALIHHILNACSVSNAMGGNIGKAALAMDMPDEGGVFVIEISSYQLDLCPNFKPDIGILLNITPDHLDRHGTMENYTASKIKIFGEGQKLQIKFPEIDARVRVCANMKGDHNLQNASAALLACEALDLDEHDIINAIQTFPGLAHRQYLVREIDDVTYVNDSKATNVESAAKALDSYEEIFWVAGGRAKEGGLKGLESHIAHIRHAYLIGEAAQEFSEWCDGNGIQNTVLKTLEEAVSLAHEKAQAYGRGTVLLSPAAASWDQFKNFEERGQRFSEIVEAFS